MTSPNPVDRGKPGSKIHALSDRTGIPLAVGVSAANTHDSHALTPLVMAIPRSAPDAAHAAPAPAKLHADKAYDIDHQASVPHAGIVQQTLPRGVVGPRGRSAGRSAA